MHPKESLFQPLDPQTDHTLFNLGCLQPLLCIVLCMMLLPVTGLTQVGNYVFGPTQTRYFVDGLPDPVCDDVYGAHVCTQNEIGPVTCSSTNLNSVIAERILETESARFLKASSGEIYDLQLHVTLGSINWLLDFPGGVLPVFVTSDGGVTFEPGQGYATLVWQNGLDYLFSVSVYFPRGTTQGALVIQIKENWYAGGGSFYLHNVIIPARVSGPVHPEQETPILGTTLDPQIPYMILHDPPGDGSSSSFQDDKTTCRSRETTYAKDESNTAFGHVKVGVKGSIGLVVNVDYEIYVQFSGSGTIGNVGILATTDEVCVSVGKGFSTADLPGAEGGGDVFMGFGRELYYGVYDVIDFKSCEEGGEAFMDNRIIYVPVEGSDRKFVYNTTAIQNEILILQAFVDDTLESERVRNQSQNQIDVWNQVLQLNENNKSNPANDTLDLVTYSSGNTQTHTSSIDVVSTSSITTEHYIDGTFGVEGVLNIAGSGFGLGYEYATSERFGETHNESEESAQIIEFTLTDDDPGDIFSVDIVRDPMFGTPVFRLSSIGSKTSCPYEGGYRRDQPVLTIANTMDTTIISSGNEPGSVASFKVDLCNNSNEERQYFLKLNAQSNLNGAEVRAAGVPLNGNDLGQEFNIAAHSCVEDLIINVTQQQGSMEENYPNLEIFLYPLCDLEQIRSSIFASVFFGDPSAVKDVVGESDNLLVYPNPASRKFTFQLTDAGIIDKWTLSDITGQMIQGSDFAIPVHVADIYTASMPRGLYLLQVFSGDRLLTKKVMLQ